MGTVNSTKSQIRVVGLTGNIASGKSFAAKFLAENGQKIAQQRTATIDADQINLQLTNSPGPVQDQLVREFGTEILNPDCTLNREYLRKKVFSDDSKRKTLESLVHPEIRKTSQKQIEDLKKSGFTLILYEASLLFETGREKDFDGILFIGSAPEIQRSRLKTRNPNFSDELVSQMIASQWPQELKRQKSTWVVENNGTIDEFKTNLTKWLKSL